ncbi:rod shape-determining protein MreD [Clostridium chauvoei]|uniref:Rod shape-determining protein MreD n=2 Tax=Clostridium chauvoei TaxID=46867 RepID=A0ABD4RG26_9CLOT|nr:rod shape-determining protein MreD [Clostridium chauvoei]ATD55867.1 rod shape-determining protein MreD [Clostridium chauvoei]ATD56461.1 rod shape-determining protein MreD [Clostridium chauvoei]MBX7280229.1 rod shape-determining protein MreD [Clostridium chauvoei]MBX7282661.1 rod shape-determining protein MreD [Clostridium chauvoei]MBX7285120.1 rod shape-determining protein MreD [Clostridium chauvoei]
MKKWILILISIGLLILDNSLMPFLAIKGAFPSLLFMFAIAYSIIKGKKEAIFIGVLAGILQDIFFYNMFGVNALSNMLLCYLAAIIGENIYKNRKLIPVITGLVASLLKVLLIYVIFRFSKQYLNINIALFSTIYNTVVMFIFYNLVFKLCDNEYSINSWRIK